MLERKKREEEEQRREGRCVIASVLRTKGNRGRLLSEEVRSEVQGIRESSEEHSFAVK